MEQYRERFLRAWHGVGANDERAFEGVASCWLEPQRAYHTAEHLSECLAWLDVCPRPDEPAQLELALFFHDAVYEPQRTDNEAASARMFSELARAAGVPQAALARVAALIESTAKHDAEGGDAALLADIDLSILGASPARYARFEKDVRREYAMFDDATYRAGRARVLEGFLQRMSIYKTPFFARLEPQARDNLARALNAVRTPSR